MKVARENLGNHQVQLQVEVEKEAVGRAIDQVYRHLAKEVNIPGFRRGRAPKHILTRYVGQARLHQDALEKLVQESYDKALVEADVHPVDQPSIDIDEFEEGKELRFKATVTVKPDPAIQDYHSISVASEVAEVTDADVQQVIDSLLDEQSVLEPTEDDDTFQEGRFAIVSLETPEAGTEEEQGPKEYIIEFGRNQLLPDADQQLAGAKVGEERTITHEWPQEEAPETTKVEGQTEEAVEAAREVQLKVTLKGLRVKKAPELNDDFVASLNVPVSTVDELRDTIRARLQANNEETARRAQLEKVHEELLERSEVDIPEVMVENRMDRLMDEFEQTLKRRNLDLGNYLAMVQQERDDFRASFRERAERLVKLDLALEKIAGEEGIECTEEDLQEVVGSLAQSYQDAPDALKSVFQTAGFMEYLKSTVIVNKTNRFLAERAKENASSPDGTSATEALVQEVPEEDAG